MDFPSSEFLITPVTVAVAGAKSSILIDTTDTAFPHHYQGRIDFNTVNPCHSTGMDLVSIPAGRAVLANPVPRAKIFQCSPCREMNSHPHAMNM